MSRIHILTAQLLLQRDLGCYVTCDQKVRTTQKVRTVGRRTVAEGDLLQFTASR